ncbi:GNAT family N-acetyltransferase [Kovacikia minuta CCNUW1]|uniref:GNAT family N-acetyltransferase n=1 Tax=Kovacikia minuta TaxID=2931930 RepID=UPI001CCABDFA|nr:GNAT family N-acetyltransferase [Kovacikia minuta]UBF25130.1 GNAT family N-acetyltransferase [Kovacikia minuta CCNUW1]
MSNFFSPLRHYQSEFYGKHSDSLGFTVRIAQQGDLADLVEILASSFHPQKEIMRWLFPLIRMGIYEDLRQRLKAPSSANYICLVAVSSSPNHFSRVVGTVEIALRANYPFQIRGSYYPYLSNLAVHTDYRRHGVAQRLLDACEHWVIDQGFYNIHLHVLEDNFAAKQLYLKAGYQLQSADAVWCSWLLKRPRKLLLQKKFA